MKQKSLLLSPRELEIIILVDRGLSNPQIAEMLKLGLRTIETHRERFSKKLEEASAAEGEAYEKYRSTLDNPSDYPPYVQIPVRGLITAFVRALGISRFDHLKDFASFHAATLSKIDLKSLEVKAATFGVVSEPVAA